MPAATRRKRTKRAGAPARRPAGAPARRRKPAEARGRAAGSPGGTPEQGERARAGSASGTGGSATGPRSGRSGGAAEADALLAALPEPRRSEMLRIDRFIREAVPGLERLVQSGIVGYGPFRYRYASGREGDTFKIGLASRAAYISLYACAADARGYVAERYRARLPRADIGKSCVRFKRFDDLDPTAVRDLLREAERTGFGS